MSKKENPFGLDKKKYKQSEVAALLREKDDELKEQTARFRETLSELKTENEKLNGELCGYREKNALIEASIKAAEEKALETEEKARLRYALVAEKLKKFSERWANYFEYLKNKYPLYPVIKTAAELREKIAAVLSEKGVENAIDALDENLGACENADGNKPFDPKRAIKEYVAATSDNGFDLEEVLNPGELKLEDLCKELGLSE